MSLKEEMREAAAVKMDHGLYGSTAHDIRTGASATLGGEAMAAALSVCDEYEEVEMQEVRGTAPHYLRTRDSAFWEPHLPSFTVYRKKEKPEPDVTELARRAVKAWEKDDTAHRFHVAMSALAKAVEKRQKHGST